MPAFNRAHSIAETLRSLMAQTVPADEIIVVDDGSDDNTAEVLASLGAGIRTIRISNSGPAAARNAGLNAARGEFIHFFDSDDLAAANKQEVQLDALKKSGADIALGPWVKGRFSGGSFKAENHALQQRGLPGGKNLIRPLLTDWSIVVHSCMFRRNILRAAGGFDQSLFVGEDQLLFLNCLLAGARVAHAPEKMTF